MQPALMIPNSLLMRAGKSTLTDSLVAAAGIMALEQVCLS